VTDDPGLRGDPWDEPPRRRGGRLTGFLVVLSLGLGGVLAWAIVVRPAVDAWNATHIYARVHHLEQPAVPTGDGDGRPLLDGMPIPPPPADASSQRLLPVVDPGPGTTYAFTRLEDDGEPVRVDPCRPLHYVVRADGMPAVVLDAVRRAVARVEDASGVVLVEDGAVDEAPDPERSALQPERYGERWAPVLVAWSTPREYPALRGVAGLGGAITVDLGTSGSARIVSGAVTLNADLLTERLGSAAGLDYVELIATHELGHVLGLAHVDDRAELMDARPVVVDGMGPGDRAGFALAGAGPCHDDT